MTCCSVLQCVAVCCSVLQCIAVRCSVMHVLQRVAVADTNLLHCKRQGTFVCVTWLIHTHARQETGLIHMCDVTHSHACPTRDITDSYVWRDSFICVTRHIHMCDVTNSHACPSRDRTYSCVTWLIHMCDVTHSHVCDSFVCATWHIHMCD